EKDLTSGEQLELREPNRTASILLVDRDQRNTSRYRCSVRHEGGPVEAPATQEPTSLFSAPPSSPPSPDSSGSPPSSAPTSSAPLPPP
uniref:Uncharacterized protein n=1 Tax=Poecilia formosa TaxID=48698 RepID=A0A087XH58_POEFO